MIELIALPLFAGILISSFAGPLGCFVIWRKMAYFGDSIAHAALIGIVMGTVFNQQVPFVVLTCVLASALVTMLRSRFSSNDTALAIVAHGSLAIGLIMMSLVKHKRIDFQSALMGDPLAISIEGTLLLAGTSLVLITLLMLGWRRYLLITIDTGLSRVEGVNTNFYNFSLNALLSIAIALSVSHVGVLLISGLLVIPAASARFISSSPEAMALNASFIAGLCYIAGLATSFYFDIPLGASIVACTLLAYFTSRLSSALRGYA